MSDKISKVHLQQPQEEAALPEAFQIEMVDKLYDVIHGLVDDLKDDIASSQVFGNGLMNSFVVQGRVDKAAKAATKIALDAMVAEGEVLGLYDDE